MHLSCDCLNIFVTSKYGNFSNIDLKLCKSFTNDIFFKEDIAILSLCSISVQVPSLVKERETGQWKIYKCTNCDTSCYCIGEILDIGSIIARKDLEIETNKINRLKLSDTYSPIFKIVLSRSDLSSDDESDHRTAFLYPSAISWLNEQTALTEERVKKFSEKEYAALDDLRQRAYKDQKAIIRREKACSKKIFKQPTVDEICEQFPKTSIGAKLKVAKKSSLDKSSIDTGEEGIFMFEGFEPGSGYQANNEYTDSDGSDDSASYQPRRVAAKQFAKSLPIPVPQFMEDLQQSDDQSPEVPTDIAASIKALAKSVHGDSVFGELPPPRFSSTHL